MLQIAHWLHLPGTNQTWEIAHSCQTSLDCRSASERFKQIENKHWKYTFNLKYQYELYQHNKSNTNTNTNENTNTNSHTEYSIWVRAQHLDDGGGGEARGCFAPPTHYTASSDLPKLSLDDCMIVCKYKYKYKYRCKCKYECKYKYKCKYK